MEKQVFRGGTFVGVLINFVITTIIIVLAYNAFKAPVVLLFWFVTLFMAIGAVRNRLIIEDGILRFDRLMKSKEIPLMDISEIVFYEDAHSDTSGESKKKYVYVSDQTNRTVFKFPYSYVMGRKDIQRFKDTIHASNPEIKVKLDSNIIEINRFVEDYKTYRKNKKREEDA